MSTPCANILAEDPKGGADPHWSQTGRAAITGFIHFIASKCEKARANDYFWAGFTKANWTEEDKQVLEGYYEEIEMHNPAAVRAINDLRNNSLTVENYVPIGTWDLLPEKWVGREACIAMIMEWLTEAQIKQGQEIKRRLAEGDQNGRHGRSDARLARFRGGRSAKVRLCPTCLYRAFNLKQHAG